MFHQKFTTLAEIPSEHYPYMRLPELKEEPFSQINIASATHFSSPFIISGHLGFIIELFFMVHVCPSLTVFAPCDIKVGLKFFSVPYAKSMEKSCP